MFCGNYRKMCSENMLRSCALKIFFFSPCQCFCSPYFFCKKLLACMSVLQIYFMWTFPVWKILVPKWNKFDYIGIIKKQLQEKREQYKRWQHGIATKCGKYEREFSLEIFMTPDIVFWIAGEYLYFVCITWSPMLLLQCQLWHVQWEEHGNEPSYSINRSKSVDHLSSYHLVKYSWS